MKSQNPGDRIGLSTLCAVIAAASICIAVQGHPAPATSIALPPLIESAGLSRFRADAWYLPDEALLGLVSIPAGAFLMGSDPNVDATAFENERWSEASYQGNVNLPAFYIARYETTVAQFRAFVAASGYKADPLSLRGIADHPVTHVAWTDALAYARWLTSTLKQSTLTAPQLRQLLNGGWQFTLPDEAQWEKAARGSDGRIFPWGNSPARGNANLTTPGSSPTGPSAVGSIACDQCAFGLADMSGNVWELTRSPYQAYPFDLRTQHADLRSDALFVMRGGSYMDPQNVIRAATRGGIDPGARREFIGFRVVLTRLQNE